MTKGIPNDPQAQWHLTGTWGLHADHAWPDYTGAGVLVGILDDGFDYTHTELAANYRTDIDLDTLGGDNNPVNEGMNRHGTAVAGVIGADDNGQGGVGVAFDADLVGIRQGFGAETNLAQTLQAFNYARTAGIDVLNNSWGFSSAFGDDNGLEFAGVDFYQIRDAMANLVAQGRDGLGTAIVFSAGNARSSGENVNYHNLQNSPYSITVAAIDSDGTYSSFSNKGANLLVSAGGTGIYTADNTGAGGYSSGNFTNFSGTSASAPVISGMVALMLEANAELGWRDIQEIIAYSSQHNDAASAGWQYNDAKNWNGGGLHFSHDYGFGAANAHAAVRLAETWDWQQISANMVTTAAFNASPALAIPASGTVSTSINVGTNIEIEHVIIDLDIDHAKAGDLVVTLVGPDGTRSVLVDRIQNGNYVSSPYGLTGIDFEMTSKAHWGEKSQGTWTLEIADMAGGNAGVLNNWSVKFLGNNHAADDLYIYTDNFGTFAGAELTARSVLNDADGGNDTLNLAALTGAASVDLDAGQFTIAGKNVAIANGSTIEKVYGGDGNDTLTGDGLDNDFFGGRGDDTLIGGGGDDLLDGGAGTDTVSYAAAVGHFEFTSLNASTLTATHLGGAFGADTLTNIENYIFAGVSYTRAALEALTGSGSVQDVIMTFTSGLKTFQFTSSANETRGLSLKNMNMSTSLVNVVELERDGEDLAIRYLSTAAPAAIRVDGSGGVDSISVTGVKSSLAASIYAGDGNDTVTFSLKAIGIVFAGAGNDAVTGNAGVDTLHGEAGNDILNGAAGNDVLNGGAGDDILNGGDGNDTLNGGDGNDTLTGGLGRDNYNGDAGDDTLHGSINADRLYGGADHDTLHGNEANDYLYGETGNDTLDGGLGNDFLYGAAGADTLDGGDGNDRIYGGTENDTASGGAGRDMLYGEDGNDVMTGGIESDRLYGGNHDDTLSGDTGADYLYGEAGNDTLSGGADNDRLYGGEGADTINGDAGDDMVYGENGDDVLSGGTNLDRLFGGEGNDTLSGDAGTDNLYGENGDDTLNGGADADRLYGGEGHDSLNGDAGDDLLYGDNGNDALHGGDGNDKLYGRNDDDTLTGGNGADFLYGDAGNDTLSGGGGIDALYGGTGNDVFAFTTLGDGIDAVRDFAAGDRLNISNILTGFTPGVSDINLFVRMSGSSTKTFSINADGAGSDFVQAFTAGGIGTRTVSDLFNTGVLITDMPV